LIELCSLEHQLVFTDQLEVHLIELPKYRGEAAVLSQARPVEKWAYFLGHAAQMEVPDIERLFRDPVFVEAGGILEMISQTEEERVRYELRMKALRDLRDNLESAELRGLETGRQQGREEGRQEGRQEGRLEGTIQTLQELLGEPVTNSDELAKRDPKQLAELAGTLQTRLRTRLA
jgi:predicted transposase/invertase (TIGR01784 family)